MKLVDTNVFIYAQGAPHPYREPCRRLVAHIGSEPGDYVIDTELLQEILHVYATRGQRQRGLSIFDTLIGIFPNPVPIGREEIVAARHILERHHALSLRDAIHAAVVQTQALEGIVSTDQAFAEVTGVTLLHPLALFPDR